MTTFSRIFGFLLLTLFILLTSCSSDDDAQVVLPEPTGIKTAAELASYFESIIETEQVPGFAVSIAKNNGLIKKHLDMKIFKRKKLSQMQR